MSRYIDEDDVRAAVTAWDMQDLYLPIHFLDLLEDVPTADVAPAERGRWVMYPRAHYFKCSNCKKTVPYRKAMLINGKREYNYCPNCGARMDGKECENDE